MVQAFSVTPGTMAIVSRTNSEIFHASLWSSERKSSSSLHESITSPKIDSSKESGGRVMEDLASIAIGQADYDWKKSVWYPLTYESYIPSLKESAEAIPIAIFNEPLVLWRDLKDKIHCAYDVCPHRSAALSEGRTRDGNLECLYHGWQYSAEKDGKCVKIPQLADGATIPKQACIKMKHIRIVEGIVWVYMSDDPPPEGLDPPTSGNDVGSPSFNDKYSLYDFQIDLPYDHSYLVENLLDPAHIPISHDRTPGGGKRENAQAYEMEIDKDSMSPQGFTGRYRNTVKKKDGSENPWTMTKFEAPGIIRYRTVSGKITFAGNLHCIPVGLGRSRLLFRVYFAGIPKFARMLIELNPMWYRHLKSCKILEQDLGLITTQEDYFTRTNRNLSQDFLLLRSSDAFVGQYRKWLDVVGGGMPWFQGLTNASKEIRSSATSHELRPGLDPIRHRSSGILETRYHRHVLRCPASRKALMRIKKGKKISLAVACVAFAASINMLALPVNPVRTSPAIFRRLGSLSVPLFAGLAALLGRLEKSFYVSFSRREELQTEVGL
jgi:phenylpropionate dioxygenase-like ring-hydroxylating dioxygenase large terminal subunit